jgi:hypothetical protein
VITRPMLERPDYLEEYVAFWNARPEVDHIWVSLYTPQIGEQSAEMLAPDDRERVAAELPALRRKFPKLLMHEGVGQAFLHPPKDPDDCIFSKMSANYSADLKTRVEPCVFGGAPDCSQCGCAASSGLHWIRTVKVAGPVRVGHFVGASVGVGTLLNRMRRRSSQPGRWKPAVPPITPPKELVQIDGG